MQRSVIGFVGAMIVSASVMSAEQKSAQPSSGSAASADQTVTFTGCLFAGSTKGTYTLQAASEKGKKSKDNGKVSLSVVPADPKVSLDPQVQHAVEITGTVSAATPSGGSTSDLPVLTAKKVKWHADFCG